MAAQLAATRTLRKPPLLALLMLVTFVAAEGSALAQTRRGAQRPAAPPADAVSNFSPDALAGQIAQAQGRSTAEDARAAEIQALIAAAPPANTQARTWEEFVRNNPRRMQFLRQQALAYPVRGGMHFPGFGVVNGSMFGGPNTFGERVSGGWYIPGFGVQNGEGLGGPNVRGQRVRGGTMLPGFGVMGGTEPGTVGPSFAGPLPSGPVPVPFAGGPAVSGFNTVGALGQFQTNGLPVQGGPAVSGFNTAGALGQFNTAGAYQGFNTAGAVNTFNTAGAVNTFNAAGAVNTFNAAGAVNQFQIGRGVLPATSMSGARHTQSPLLNQNIIPRTP